MKRRERRLRRKELKKRNTKIVLTMVFLISIFSVGYAAFQTNVNINVTGKIKNVYTVADIKGNTVTGGDGLCDNGDGTYSFKGANPNNYIKFNNETWRIMSIDSNGRIKIIKDERIDLTGYSVVDSSDSKRGKFDASGSTGRRTSGYCSQENAPNNGCNAWASTSNMVGSPSSFVNGSFSGVVTDDSELKTYLNGTYWNSISSSAKKYVEQNMMWNIGPAGTYGNDGENYSISTLSQMEKTYTWIGNVGLATKSEYMNANTNSSCLTASALYNTKGTDACRTTNYLWKSSYWWWLMNAYSGNAYDVLIATANGFVDGYGAAYANGSVRPSLYLKSNIKLSGNGGNTNGTIYKIIDLNNS